MAWYSKEKQIEIHNLRLHERIGEPPNANSHITFKGGFYGEPVTFSIGKREKK